MAEEEKKEAPSQEGDEGEVAKPKPSKFGKLMKLFTPLENFAKDSAKDLPIIRTLDGKLNMTTKRIILAVGILLSIIIVVILFLFALKPKYDVDTESNAQISQDGQSGAEAPGYADADGQGGGDSENASFIPDIVITSKPPVIDDENLEEMIKKADLMYKTGNKQEALLLFNQIAAYSKAIANYNLGVINARSQDYKKSLQYYDEAIRAGEDIPLSAINAAVSAFKLGDMKRFEYYIGVANTYANQISNLPPYAYSYALNQYYQGHYFEALSPLTHDSSQDFDSEKKRLAAKMYALFNDHAEAYSNLRAVAKDDDELALGQLMARQGELNAARGHIFTYLINHPDDWRARMSLQIVSLKLGDFLEAAKIINELDSAQKELNVVNPYPIKARVSPSIFDIELAQQQFWDRTFEHSNLLTSKILFYYAPYRVFNVAEAIGVISDGVLDSKINQGNLEESHAILLRGATISSINLSIAQALKHVNNNNLRQALGLLDDFVKQNPNHAVLHYDVGLIQAQMGNFAEAHKHFLKAYHLDSTDLQSGVFALITGKLIYKDTTTLSTHVAQSILESKMEEDELYLYTKLKEWNNNPKVAGVYKPKLGETRAIAFAFQSISAMHAKDMNNIIAGFDNLRRQRPHDIVSHLLHNLAENYGSNVKNAALNLQAIFRDETIDLDNVFYGSNLARELYVYVGLITGNLERQKKILNHKLSTQPKNSSGLLQALGLLNIYAGAFEESYAIYDRLINTLKEDDSITRYMGAVAAIGAGEKNAASLLLQLSKMSSSVNHESRYALGLLYQEAGNYNAAAQHFNSISNQGFQSEFLDFVVDESKIALPE